MKISITEKDISFIKNVNEELTEGKNPILFVQEQGKEYGITFEVIDVAKANAFLSSIVMNCNTDAQKEVEDTIGIRFKALKYSDTVKQDVVRVLKEAIDRIEHM